MSIGGVVRHMKILHVIPSLAAAHGGPSRAMRVIEQALRARGIVMETASTDDDGAGGRIERPQAVLVREGSADRRYFRKTANPYKVSLGFLRWAFRHVRDYDVVHIHALFSFTSTIAALAARRAGVPYVIRPLGTLAPYGMTTRRPWVKRLSVALLERRILRHAAAIHFTSASEQQQVADLGLTARGVVIPLALESMPRADASAFHARFPALKDKSFVLFLARLDPVKNLEALLDAIALCRHGSPDLQWLIAGSGSADYSSALRARAARLGVADRIIWAGHLEGGVKAAALELADLFVLPSFSENFGIAAAEALQAGLPVVLGKGVALSAQVEAAGAGKAVEPQPEAIAAAVHHYLGNPMALALAAANALTLATEAFSQDTMAASLSNLYESILSAPDKKWTGEVVSA